MRNGYKQGIIVIISYLNDNGRKKCYKKIQGKESINHSAVWEKGSNGVLRSDRVAGSRNVTGLPLIIV